MAKHGLSQGEGVVYVTADKLRELVESEGGVTIPEAAVVVFGGFRYNEEGELEIRFAWDGTDNHPTEWIKPPSFLRPKGE